MWVRVAQSKLGEPWYPGPGIMKEGVSDLMSFWLWLTLSVDVCVHRWVLHVGVCVSEHVRSWWFENGLNERGPERWVERIKWKERRQKGGKKQKEKCFWEGNIRIPVQNYTSSIYGVSILSNCHPRWPFTFWCRHFSVVLAWCSCVPAASFGLVLLVFRGPMGCFSSAALSEMGRVPLDCVLASGLHKPQLPNKHQRHGDGGRGRARRAAVKKNTVGKKKHIYRFKKKRSEKPCDVLFSRFLIIWW